jgi:accessory gene regulator protein AgrB
MLRRIAEIITNNYREDWGDNERIKEACICSVENIISLILNMIILIILAIFFSKEKECLVFFLVNGILRSFSGGIHAPTHTKCILSYCIIMFTSIYLAEQLGEMSPVLSCITPIVAVYAVMVNYRYGGMQKRLELSENKKYHSISVKLSTLIGAFLIVSSWIDHLRGGLLQAGTRSLLWICCFALITQTTSLFLARDKCYNRDEVKLL